MELVRLSGFPLYGATMKTEQSITATLAAMTQQTARIASMAQTSNDECIHMSARIDELEKALKHLVAASNADELDPFAMFVTIEHARHVLAKGN